MGRNQVGGLTTPLGAVAKIKKDPKSFLTGQFALEDIERMSQTQQVDAPKPGAIGTISTADRARQLNQANLARNMAVQAQQRAAPSAAVAQDFRGQQLGLAQQLAAQAQGQGPSPAQAAAQLQLLAARQQAASTAASQPGASPGLALRGALQTQEGLGAQSAGALAQARAQEQLNAQQALAGLSGQARGQDILGVELQAQTELQQRQMNDLQARALRGEATERELADLRAMMQTQQLQAQSTMQTDQLAAQIAMFNAQQADKASAGFMSAIGTGAKAIFSDQRFKTEVRELGAELDEALAAIKPALFKYKGQAADKVGVMAQDVKNTLLGEQSVDSLGGALFLTPDVGVVLASLARLSQRLDALERAIVVKDEDA